MYQRRRFEENNTTTRTSPQNESEAAHPYQAMPQTVQTRTAQETPVRLAKKFNDSELEVALILVGTGRQRVDDESERTQYQAPHRSSKSAKNSKTIVMNKTGDMPQNNDKEDLPIVGGLSVSEVKRENERKRRKDLTTAFDELAALILKIEEGESETCKKKRKLANQPGMTRVDLIIKTIDRMEQLRQENEELKLSLSQHCSKQDVVVMVPTLTPADDVPPKFDDPRRSPFKHQYPLSHYSYPPKEYYPSMYSEYAYWFRGTPPGCSGPPDQRICCSERPEDRHA